MPELTPEQKQLNYEHLQSTLVDYHNRGHKTFKCKNIAHYCDLSASAIGRFYINHFVDIGMIGIFALPARGIVYRFNKEYFNEVV